MREALHTRNMTLVYDADKRICICTWGETTTPSETGAGIDWMVELVAHLPAERSLLGSIIDFSEVVVFDEESLWRQEVKPDHHQLLHQRQGTVMAELPTALIVKTLYHATYVGTTLRAFLVEQPDEMPRVRIVPSHEEAEAHIMAWHAYHRQHQTPVHDN